MHYNVRNRGKLRLRGEGSRPRLMHGLCVETNGTPSVELSSKSAMTRELAVSAIWALRLRGFRGKIHNQTRKSRRERYLNNEDADRSSCRTGGSQWIPPWTIRMRGRPSCYGRQSLSSARWRLGLLRCIGARRSTPRGWWSRRCASIS